jgi:hypothetical protein
VALGISAGASLQFIAKVSPQEKALDGLSLELSVFLSTDAGVTWRFVSQILWHSFGVNGVSTDTPGQGPKTKNPDPTVAIPVPPSALTRVKFVVLSHGVTSVIGLIQKV